MMLLASALRGWRKPDFNIRTTLLLIISLLAFLLAAQAGVTLVRAFANYALADRLREVSETADLLLRAEKYLSLERGATTALLSAPPAAAGMLALERKDSRAQADAALNEALARLDRDKAGDGARDQVKTLYTNLNSYRARVDDVLAVPGRKGQVLLANQSFDVSTKLIAAIYNLLEDYMRPALLASPEAARQMRFRNVVWVITEYAGREYAVLGQLIAENHYPEPIVQEGFAVWHGRVQYAWELARDSTGTNAALKPLKPLLDEAEARYALTFDQIRSIFRPEGRPRRGIYPITVSEWLELSHQTMEALYAMSDGVAQVNITAMKNMRSRAVGAMLMSILLFCAALAISFYSWRFIRRRVVQPVDEMVNALYRATQGEAFDMLHLSTQYDEIGKLSRVLTIFQENVRQLAAARDKAEAASIAKSEFLANMSHEIRTPMNVILGLATILKGTPLNPKQKEFVNTLHGSAEGLMDLINDLLDVSKIESNRFELEKIPFSLTATAGEVCALIKVKAEEKGLGFVCDLKGVEHKSFIGDPVRLRQIMLNLCSNAVKFTDKGKVILSVSSAASGPGMENVTLAVRDTGIGIPSDKIGYIFEKFTQVDSSVSRRYGGTGLGLAITKAFVEMMGGAILVESTPGAGSTFLVTVPLPVATLNMLPDLRKRKASNA